MKNTFDVDFCFKGNRTYVQGPDIFESVVSLISCEFDTIRDIKYTAYKMLHKNATVYITNKVVKSNYSVINSLISFMGDGTKYYAVVCENYKSIKCSNDYCEDVVERNSQLSPKSIAFKNTLPETYTEIVVSMNKFFLNKTIAEEGKWIVTKFDYFQLSDIQNIKNKEIKIELLQNLNNKLTKSLLYLDDKQVGYLYFSLIPKES